MLGQNEGRIGCDNLKPAKAGRGHGYMHKAWSMKRILDLLIAIPSFLFLSPLMVYIGICVRLKIGGDIFFRQDRPGYMGRPFTMYKFRTMTDAKDEKGGLLPDAKRLTSLGTFLRASSLDELPELINIINGDMSIVGPRPLLMRYLERYTCEQARRNDVKPGLTGWAQVNGRNELSWDEKFKLDVWYVENQSFRLDARIILMTLKKVLKREGISHQGDATMPEFKPITKNNCVEEGEKDRE
jgi:sugar transferase EpsL